MRKAIGPFCRCAGIAAILAIALGTPAGPALTQSPSSSPYSPDVPERGSVEAIREYTTSEEYLPATVAFVPGSETVPSPTEFLGHLAGAPGELSSVKEVYGYFRELATASDRVTVSTIGTTEEGREIMLAAIAEPGTLGNLRRFKEITSRLADPRLTSRAEMEALAAEGKPIYYLMGGLHSAETGPPEMLMELAYRLAVSEQPEIKEIRENVIVLITPVMEPDGRDRQVEWYYRHLKDSNLLYEEQVQFCTPPYWGHYVYHDNNRDGMQLTLALSRAVNRTYEEYHPQFIHDLHESVPLLYISTGHGPYSLALDPVTINEWMQLAYHEEGALQSMGLSGVWTWGFWDGWWPGYLFSIANNRNSVGRFYETFGNCMAGTFERKLKESTFAGKPVTDVQWYRPWPPAAKVTWSLRDNINYMEAGVLEALHYTALHRTELLRNFWIKGDRAVAKGRSEAPYAWVFPAEQPDEARLVYLLNLLRQQGIEVHRLTETTTIGDETYPKGSYVVRMDQPYRNAAVNFLERQDFPPDEANRPYDDVAWTWPLLFGVDATRIEAHEILDAPMSMLDEDLTVTGRLSGTGGVFLLRDQGQNAFLAARVLLGRSEVLAAEAQFEAAGQDYPPGSWIIAAERTKVERVAAETGLSFTAVMTKPEVRTHKIDLPRLALLHTWTSTQDCGWARYTLDQEGVPYTLINPDDLKEGRLIRRFDVILFPNSWGDFARMVHGIDPKFGPLAYTKTPEFPSHGIPDSSPDITGGMGFRGLENLQQFIQEGGVLVTMANAGILAVDGGLVRGVRRASMEGVRTPGSELRAKVLRPDHPITYGYPELTSVFRGSGPIFDVPDYLRGLAVIQFGTHEPEESEDDNEGQSPTEKSGAETEDANGQTPKIEKDKPAAQQKGSAPQEAGSTPKTGAVAPAPQRDTEELVLSGFASGKKMIDGKPAILDVPVGKGRVILFAFNPMHRYLNHSDFRFVYNVILNWNDLPAAP
jgi:hypothetical protein